MASKSKKTTDAMRGSDSRNARGRLRVRLKQLREAQGLSQVELATRAGVRQGTVSDYERGKTRKVDLDVLARLAAALGVDPGYLIVPEAVLDPKDR